MTQSILSSLRLIISWNKLQSNCFSEGIEPTEKPTIHLTTYRGGRLLAGQVKENKAKESEKERKARTKRLIELGGFIEGQLSEESISILKVLPRFRFVKMDNYLKKIAVEAGGIENLRRLQVEKVDTQGNVQSEKTLPTAKAFLSREISSLDKKAFAIFVMSECFFSHFFLSVAAKRNEHIGAVLVAFAYRLPFGTAP